MENDWAIQNLQTIRTLMERSAIYRRALAPVMIVTGSIGVLAAVLPCFVRIDTNRRFSLFWLAVSLLALIASFLLVRRQALKDAEPFWSPPTRRVTQALLPAFCVGLVAGSIFVVHGSEFPDSVWFLSVVWTICYGCALHAAGFFMQRGIKLFGWLFVLGGVGLLFASSFWSELQSPKAAHYVMGTFFGGLHLAYGIYLYFTEKIRTTT